MPGHWRELRAVSPQNAKWFFISGTLVYVSQIFAYMAVAIAPVTVTAPIIALANIFRLYFARVLNPGPRNVSAAMCILATALSFLAS